MKGFVQYRPSVKYIKWQKYHNGEFVDINIHKGKYKGTTNILPNPELVLNDIEKEDGVEFRIKIQRINTAEYSSSHNMKVVRARGETLKYQNIFFKYCNNFILITLNQKHIDIILTLMGHGHDFDQVLFFSFILPCPSVCLCNIRVRSISF